jgi:hypothetical protein
MCPFKPGNTAGAQHVVPFFIWMGAVHLYDATKPGNQQSKPGNTVGVHRNAPS